MAAITLIDVVKSTLNAISGDEVSSVADTPDALQIASLCRDVFEELISITDWPHLFDHSNLTTVADANAPTYLTIDGSVARIDSLRYNTTKASDANETWKTLEWKDPEEFIDITFSRKSGDADVEVSTGLGGAGIKLYVHNDTDPTYWTTFDDSYIVLDAYDVTEDPSGAVGTKALAKVKTFPVFDETTDGFVIPLPEYMHALYKARVRVKAFETIKQIPSRQDDREATRQLIRSRRHGRARLTQKSIAHTRKGR